VSKPIDQAQFDAARLLESAREQTLKTSRAWFLRFLRWGAGASNSQLVGVLFEDIGLRLSHATVQACGAWLSEQGYLRIEVFEMATVYRLTRLGDDVARGLVVDDGVGAIGLCDVEADEIVIRGLRAH